MAISPILLFWLLVASFLFGVAVGVVNDLFRLSRVLLGVRYSGKRMDALYERPLPIVRRPLRRISDSKVARGLLLIVVFMQDVLLFCFAGVGTVVLNYYFNQGRFRFYTVFSLLFGFLLYYFTVGKLVTAVSELIVFFVRVLVCVTGFLLFRPFMLFFEFLEKIVKNMGENIKKTIANKRKRVYNIGKRKAVMKQAETGFISISIHERREKE